MSFAVVLSGITDSTRVLVTAHVIPQDGDSHNPMPKNHGPTSAHKPCLDVPNHIPHPLTTLDRRYLRIKLSYFVVLFRFLSSLPVRA